MYNSKRVTILAVGVWIHKQGDIDRLDGPVVDLANMEALFTNKNEVGIYDRNQFFKLENPSLSEVQKWITDYAMSRTSRGDILVIYFSGHGFALPPGDFGLCMSDTRVRPEGGILPLSTLRISDIAYTLSAANVYPVFIIDACFSGRALLSEPFNPHALFESAYDKMAHILSSFEIICSSSSELTSTDDITGGLFTSALFSKAREGMVDVGLEDGSLISLQQLYVPIQTYFEELGENSIPKYYRAYSMPDFALCANRQNRRATPVIYTFADYFKDLIRTLWNNGTPIEMSLEDIRKQVGVSAYGNHRKLSRYPWDLIANGTTTRHRVLTPKGRQFAQGIIAIPSQVQVRYDDPNSYEAVVGCDDVRI